MLGRALTRVVSSSSVPTSTPMMNRMMMQNQVIQNNINRFGQSQRRNISGIVDKAISLRKDSLLVGTSIGLITYYGPQDLLAVGFILLNASSNSQIVNTKQKVEDAEAACKKWQEARQVNAVCVPMGRHYQVLLS